MNSIKIGLLEFGIRSNRNPKIVLSDVIEYAKSADDLGFSRFWLGEHYTPLTSLPWHDPTMLLPVLANVTSQISIGVAGYIFSLHNPFKVALDFRLLSQLFLGRIDLGITKGIINDKRFLKYIDAPSTYGLEEYLDLNIKRLDTFLNKNLELLKNGCIIPPFGGNGPDLWYLGKSLKHLDLCLRHRLNFSLSMFHHGCEESIDSTLLFDFIANFREKHNCCPKINIAISGYCSKNNNDLAKFRNKKPSSGFNDSFLIGPPSLFIDKLGELANNFPTNEFIFYNSCTDMDERLRCIELLSETFGLYQSVQNYN